MENSKEQFINIMKKSNKDMSITTINHHVNRIRMIKKVVSDGEFADYDGEFLDHKPQNVIKSIYNKWDNNQTRKTYIYTCVSVSQAYKLNNKVIKYYKDEYNKVYRLVADHYESKTLSKKQEKNFINIKEIDSLIKKLEKDVDLLFEITTNWTISKIKKVREFILLLIYRNFRFRNDVADMKYFILDDELDIELLRDDGNNYLVIDEIDDTMYFLINVYKTKKTYGTKKIMISGHIEFEISRYINILNKKKINHLIFNQSLNGATSHELTMLLSLITKKYFNKSITSTMFNNIIETAKFGKEERERVKDAKERGQSLNIQHSYIKFI